MNEKEQRAHDATVKAETTDREKLADIQKNERAEKLVKKEAERAKAK